jgi:hypothetical protein
MKLSISLAALFLTVSASANASTIVFVKKSRTGLVSPAVANSTTCAIYNDKVVVKVKPQSTGIVETKEKAIELDSDWQSIVNSLVETPVLTSKATPDTGTVSYLGYPFPIDFPSQPITLYARLPVQIERRDSAEVATLITLIDEICASL